MPNWTRQITKKLPSFSGGFFISHHKVDQPQEENYGKNFSSSFADNTEVQQMIQKTKKLKAYEQTNQNKLLKITNKIIKKSKQKGKNNKREKNLNLTN